MEKDRGAKSVLVRLALIASISAGAAIVGFRLGDETIDRLPDHRGYYLVSVIDTVEPPIPRRPRHTVVVVVDGLRQDRAEALASVAALRARGQCRAQDNGKLTISRPLYTVLSSGLEVDRNGSRNNDLTEKVGVDSIWQRAREAGLSVAAYSELPWWQQLFPDAFTNYTVSVTENLFALAELSDLTLIHPVYVDEAGHDAGAASALYDETVKRLEGELAQLLAKIDFERDLVVFTADHGHTASGGHGGPEPEVARVLTCFAGVGVAASPDTAPFDGRSFAPTLAVLLGIPFPAHMRATDDRLDEIFSVVDSSVGAAYLDGRRAGIRAFRAENRAKLAHWLNVEVSPDLGWEALYRARRTAQQRRALAAVLLVVVFFVAFLHVSKIGWGRGAALALWVVLALFAGAAIYSLWRGGFGFTSINTRAEFLRYGLASSLAAMVAAAAIHLAIWRDAAALARDSCIAALVAMALAVLHRLVYGVPFGFPLPSDGELFFPFYAAAMTSAASAAALAAAAVSAVSAILKLRRRGV